MKEKQKRIILARCFRRALKTLGLRYNLPQTVRMARAMRSGELRQLAQLEEFSPAISGGESEYVQDYEGGPGRYVDVPRNVRGNWEALLPVGWRW